MVVLRVAAVVLSLDVVVVTPTSSGIAKVVVVGVVDVVFRLDSGVDVDVAVTVVSGVVVVAVVLLKATIAVEELGRDEGLM